VGVYSNQEIREAIDEGHIICVPLDKHNISHASLDVTLGHYYYRTERTGDHTVYNPFDFEDVKRYFGECRQAISHKDWSEMSGVKPIHGIPLGHPVIPIRPGERILAHTHEFFGINPPGAYELKSRSSWGRNGIAVCFDAGWVDPGYINRLTLEIFNLNQHETILLPVGERIAQAVFHETGPVEGNYGEGRNDGFSGKYQSGTDLKTLIKNWAPEQMLPRAYLDQRQQPEGIPGLKGL
jgi:deoxycytidine triphosphate deaminase